MPIDVGTRVTDSRSYPADRTGVVREVARWDPFGTKHFRVEYVSEEGIGDPDELIAAPTHRWAVEAELTELAALSYSIGDTVTIAGRSGVITDVTAGVATVEQTWDHEFDGGGFMERTRTFQVPTWELELIDI